MAVLRDRPVNNSIGAFIQCYGTRSVPGIIRKHTENSNIDMIAYDLEQMLRFVRQEIIKGNEHKALYGE